MALNRRTRASSAPFLPQVTPDAWDEVNMNNMIANLDYFMPGGVALPRAIHNLPDPTVAAGISQPIQTMLQKLLEQYKQMGGGVHQHAQRHHPQRHHPQRHHPQRHQRPRQEEGVGGDFYTRKIEVMKSFLSCTKAVSTYNQKCHGKTHSAQTKAFQTLYKEITDKRESPPHPE
jgi:hypothetical protein